MSEPTVNFHAYFPAGFSEEDVDAAHDAAADAVGFTLRGIKHDTDGGITRRYGAGGAETLPFAYTLRPPCQLAMFGLWRSRAGIFAPAAVVEMFTRICESLNVDLARTDQSGGIGLVQPSEVSGTLEFVDWFQYVGPRLATVLGRERLLTAPVFRVEERGHGIMMMLAADPFEGNLPRRRVSEHLGITLRPLLGRNPATGAPIVIPWR